MRKYWKAMSNDGVELSDSERATRAEAIKDCKEAYRFDCEEVGGEYDPGDSNDYYVEQYIETETEFIYGDAYDVKMKMGPRGGITCKVSKRTW